MQVSELIKALQVLPQDAHIVFDILYGGDVPDESFSIDEVTYDYAFVHLRSND